MYYLKQEKLEFYGENKYLENRQEFDELIARMYNQEWVSYCKPPFKNAKCVIRYLGRYTHRVAISNNRIIKEENGEVTFKYRDYKDNKKIKEMTIKAEEFIRRFLMHVLPDNFVKIKHYGILANRGKKAFIKLCRVLMNSKIFSDFTLIKKTKRKLQEFTCNFCGNNTFYYTYHYLRS